LSDTQSKPFTDAGKLFHTSVTVTERRKTFSNM